MYTAYFNTMMRYRRRRFYDHKTVAGNVMFYLGIIIVLVTIYLGKKKSSDPESGKALENILMVVGFVLIVLSFIVDILFQ